MTYKALQHTLNYITLSQECTVQSTSHRAKFSHPLLVLREVCGGNRLGAILERCEEVTHGGGELRSASFCSH